MGLAIVRPRTTAVHALLRRAAYSPLPSPKQTTNNAISVIALSSSPKKGKIINSNVTRKHEEHEVMFS